jgi:hypothetical protein
MPCYGKNVYNNGEIRTLSHNYVYNIFTVYYSVKCLDFFFLKRHHQKTQNSECKIITKQRNFFVYLISEFYKTVVVAGGETNKRQEAKLYLGTLKWLSNASNVKEKIVRTEEPRGNQYVIRKDSFISKWLYIIFWIRSYV